MSFRSLAPLLVGAAILLPVAAGGFGLLQLPSEAPAAKTVPATDVTRLRAARGARE